MISGVGDLDSSWSKRAREWRFADSEGVLAVTLSEALHSYRDYLLDLAGAALLSDGETGKPDTAVDVLLRLSASTADGLWPARRMLVEGARPAHAAVLGFEFSGAVTPQGHDDRSPWFRSEAYRLARAAVSLRISLAGDPDDDELAHRELGGFLPQDSVLARLLQMLADAERLVLDAAVASVDPLCSGPEPSAHA